jgi:hypothetical protein
MEGMSLIFTERATGYKTRNECPRSPAATRPRASSGAIINHTETNHLLADDEENEDAHAATGLTLLRARAGTSFRLMDARLLGAGA